MGFVDKLLRRKKVDPDERRRHLLEFGRITEGEIIDVAVNNDGEEVILYRYELNGVELESSEILTPEQRQDPAKYAPGAKIGIRYDQRNQGNSVVE
jgi:hypothetical protein